MAADDELTTEQLAAELGVTPRSIRNYVKRGMPRIHRPGAGRGQTRFNLRAAQDWIRSNRQIDRSGRINRPVKVPPADPDAAPLPPEVAAELTTAVTEPETPPPAATAAMATPAPAPKGRKRPAPPAPAGGGAPPAPEEDGQLPFALVPRDIEEAAFQDKAYAAALKRQDLETKAGRLVDVETVAQTVGHTMEIVRTGVLALPRRIRQRIPDAPASLEAVIDSEVRKVLGEMETAEATG